MLTLFDVITLKNPAKTKFKFSMSHGGKGQVTAQDSLIHDMDSFISMIAWRNKSPNNHLDGFDYVVAFAQLADLGKNYWLFGGVYKIKPIFPKVIEAPGYYLTAEKNSEYLIGKLIIKTKAPLGQAYSRTYQKAKGLGLEIYEILPNKYAGDTFPGYQNVCLKHRKLQMILKNEMPSWKNALSQVKGVYVITDLKSGKQYVGSAYGEDGVWGRWAVYANPESVDGGNKELRKLKKEMNDNYLFSNFQYSLIEIFMKTTPNDQVIAREQYWKKVLNTIKTGMNAN